MRERGYRKIWTDEHGPIPAGYEIHHIDGDNSNNALGNLACLSLQEHHDTHAEQEDWVACYLIARRMDLTPEQISEASRKAQQQRLETGTHNFLDPEHNRRTGDNNSRVQSKLVSEGKHHWLSEEHAQAVSRRQTGKKRPEIGPKIAKKMKGNTNACGPKPKIECPHCGKIGGNSQMKRWHFDQCKMK